MQQGKKELSKKKWVVQKMIAPQNVAAPWSDIRQTQTLGRLHTWFWTCGILSAKKFHTKVVSDWGAFAVKTKSLGLLVE